jgi:hypothetical protein
MKNQMLPLSRCLDQKIVTMLQALENMPSGVEKTVHIWDLHGQQFRVGDLMPRPLLEIMQNQDGYFAGRLHQLIIVGMPQMATLLKNALWPAVPARTKAKVRFVSFEQAREHLFTVCPTDVANRILATMEQNRDRSLSLEQRKASWMRVDQHGDLVSAFPCA